MDNCTKQVSSSYLAEVVDVLPDAVVEGLKEVAEIIVAAVEAPMLVTQMEGMASYCCAALPVALDTLLAAVVAKHSSTEMAMSFEVVGKVTMKGLVGKANWSELVDIAAVATAAADWPETDCSWFEAAAQPFVQVAGADDVPCYVQDSPGYY